MYRNVNYCLLIGVLTSYSLKSIINKLKCATGIINFSTALSNSISFSFSRSVGRLDSGTDGQRQTDNTD